MNLYEKDEIMIFDTINQEIQNKIANKKLTEISLNEINIGNNLYINFYPCSQKFIYTLLPKYGIVKTIKNEKKINYYDNDSEYEELNIIIKNYKNKEENLMHLGVSYMGHSSGYDYCIYLVE